MKHLLWLLPLLFLRCKKEEGRPLPHDGPLLLAEAPEGTYRLLNGLGPGNTIPDFSLLSVTAINDLEDDNFSERELTTNGGEGTVELVPMSAINDPNPPPAVDLRGSVRVREL